MSVGITSEAPSLVGRLFGTGQRSGNRLITCWTAPDHGDRSWNTSQVGNVPGWWQRNSYPTTANKNKNLKFPLTNGGSSTNGFNGVGAVDNHDCLSNTVPLLPRDASYKILLSDIEGFGMADSSGGGAAAFDFSGIGQPVGFPSGPFLYDTSSLEGRLCPGKREQRMVFSAQTRPTSISTAHRRSSLLFHHLAAIVRSLRPLGGKPRWLVSTSP